MTDQDQNTKAEAKPTQLTFSSLDNKMNDLLPKIVFQFSGTEFQISEVGDAVCYLKVAIDTVETLSLLHLFMWQHRQGLLLRSDIQLIIIQDELKDPSILISEYWRNLASLSLQMGFSTISFSKYNDILQQKLTHQMIIVSDFPRIDSQQLDTMEGLSHFQFDDKMSYSMKLVILERIGLAVHEERQYAHLLPMILGYSAYLIYNQIIQYQEQDMESLVEDAGYINNMKSGKTIHLPNFPQIYIHHAQEMYTTATRPSAISCKATFIDQNGNDRIENFRVCNITQVFKNIFELPVHLVKILDFNDTNKFIFQQMCDVSYLFKAQYFAVFSAFFPLDNAVLSQSSRSGKTVTLHTIFYFNLFSGLKIPILINTGFTKDSHDLKTQPLYNRGSIEMDQRLKTLFSAYQSQTDLGDVISSNLKDGVEYSKTMAYVKTECFNLIKTYDMHTAQQQLEGAFELYLQGTSVFCEFSVTGMLNFFKFDPSKQLEQTKKILDDEIQASANKLEAAKKIIGTLNQEDSIQNQKDIIRAIELELELLTQRKNSYTAQKTQSRLVSVDSYNYSKEVILLVDECLSQQKASYASCTSALVEITNEFVDKFMENAKSSIEEVVKKVKLQSSEQVEQLLNWLEMREHNSKADPVDYNNKSLYLKEADQKITQIISDPTEVQRYFLTLIPSKLFTKCKAYEIIDLMGISSPNFINLRESQTVKESFQEMMSDLTRYSTLEVFREKLYQFLLMLYNPRGIETIFWRNISFVMNQGADTISSFHKSIEVKDKLNDYIGRKLQDEQKLIEFFIEEFGVNIIFPDDKVYTEIPFISVKVTHLLTAGTDLALINFLRQNQFLYTSENSRGKTPYTQSNILGTSQMHPSCLTQSYYRDMRITTQTNKSMIEQVNDKVKDMSIKDFYLTMMPELAAELQFLCPLVCPQIIINESATKYLFNSTYQFQLTINSKSILLNQISSHMQIYNSLFIMRNKDLVGANQLINQESKTELLKLQSIAEFNNHLHLTSSSSLNRDVVFVLHFLASQQFLTSLRLLESYVVQKDYREKSGIDQMLCLFKQQQISEISAAIFLVMQLSCTGSQDSTSADLNIVSDSNMLILNTLMRELKQYEQFLEIYFNPVYVTGYDITTPLKTIYDNVQTLFQGATFMFLQQSFDIFFQLADKQNMKSYIQHAIANAANCYATLLEMQLLKPNQKIAIVTIVDKTQISNLFFNPAPAMPDYLISLFGTTEEQTKEVLYNDMLSVHQHCVKERQFQSLNFLLESGNHGNVSVFNKSNDTGVNICFQTTNLPGPSTTQIDLIKQGRKITKEGELQAQKLLKEEEKQVYVDLEKATVNVEKLKAQLLDEESKQNAKTETIAKLTDMVKQAETKYAYAEQQIQKQDILLTKVGQIGGFIDSKEKYKSLTEKLSEIIKENEASQLALAKHRQKCKDATQQQNRKKQQDKLIEENTDLRVKEERTYFAVQDYAYEKLKIILNNVFMDTMQKQVYVVLKEGQAIQDAFKDQKMVLKYLQSKKVPRLTRANDKFVPDQTCKIDVHQFIEEYKYLFSHLGAIQEKVEEARTCIQLKTHDWVPNLLNSSRTEYKTIQPLILKELAKIVNSCTDKSKVTYKTLFRDKEIKDTKEIKSDIGITDIFTYFSRLHLFPVQVVDQTLIVCKLTTDHEQFDPPAFSQPEIEVEDTESQYEILCKSAIKTYGSELSDREIEFLQKKEDKVFDAAYKLLQFVDGFFTFKVKYQYQMSITRRQRTSFKEDCFETIYESKENLLETFTRLKVVIVAIKEGVVHVIILE